MGQQTIAIVLPNQLFADNPLFAMAKDFWLLEHPHFFTRFRYHKKKLMLHRASMKGYEGLLRDRGYRVKYVEAADCESLAYVLHRLGGPRGRKVAVVDPVESELCSELSELRADGIEMQVFESPQFLSGADVLDELLGDKKHPQMASFYARQRKRLGILVEDGRPIGGKWSFDAENRRRLPKDIRIPPLPCPKTDRHVKEAAKYVSTHFADNPGATDGRSYPTTETGARAWLADFLEQRFASFGPYEDAISREHAVLFHSVLSPLLNIGLLTPDEVVREALEYAHANSIGMASLEGFVRQMIGWREFMRGVYTMMGDEQRRTNFWKCRNSLPRSLYDGTTGIEPVDLTIRRVVCDAYAHHIERLMILGNFMLLCEIDPDEVFRWFMELFIDAYDWVMVPNVYGMSQYADGGRITTKPYISSSNYIRKMSDFPRGDWCNIWDGLFWRFVARHESVFAGNPRMRVMAVQLRRMDESRLEAHVAVAERFLAELFG